MRSRLSDGLSQVELVKYPLIHFDYLQFELKNNRFKSPHFTFYSAKEQRGDVSHFDFILRFSNFIPDENVSFYLKEKKKLFKRPRILPLTICTSWNNAFSAVLRLPKDVDPAVLLNGEFSFNITYQNHNLKEQRSILNAQVDLTVVACLPQKSLDSGADSDSCDVGGSALVDGKISFFGESSCERYLKHVATLDSLVKIRTDHAKIDHELDLLANDIKDIKDVERLFFRAM